MSKPFQTYSRKYATILSRVIRDPCLSYASKYITAFLTKCSDRAVPFRNLKFFLDKGIKKSTLSDALDQLMANGYITMQEDQILPTDKLIRKPGEQFLKINYKYSDAEEYPRIIIGNPKLKPVDIIVFAVLCNVSKNPDYWQKMGRNCLSYICKAFNFDRKTMSNSVKRLQRNRIDMAPYLRHALYERLTEHQKVEKQMTIQEVIKRMATATVNPHAPQNPVPKTEPFEGPTNTFFINEDEYSHLSKEEKQKRIEEALNYFADEDFDLSLTDISPKINNATPAKSKNEDWDEYL